MRKLAVLGAVMIVVAATAWAQRSEIKAFVSDQTREGRATYRGSGSKTADRMRIEWYGLRSELLKRDLEQVAFLPPGDSRGRSLWSALVYVLTLRGGVLVTAQAEAAPGTGRRAD